jgi:hypothetical protein
MRNARKLGVEVASVPGYEEWSRMTRDILRSRPDAADITPMRPPDATQDLAYFVAVDAGGRPVTTSVVVVFGEYAVLVRSLSAPEHPAAASSRYLLHTFMRSALRDRGVRHLIGGSGVRNAPGLHYFQHLLGYELRNLRIRVRDNPAARSVLPTV